ncbi:MAG: NUDIX hydrolase [Actinobacteria bacterium]|nr:NUDIX hydrolase [Actinomycetota bacterium]
MYTRKEDVKALESKYGIPVESRVAFEISTWEYDTVKGSQHSGRAHDVTMFIRKSDDPDKIAVIRKPFFPPEAFRAPSGAAVPGESLEEGALREAYEETGLSIELTRYLTRIYAEFTYQEKKIEWVSHVFEAKQVDGILNPLDTEEIEEARWASLEELQTGIREVLLDIGWELFRYRVALTDLSVKRMEEYNEV